MWLKSGQIHYLCRIILIYAVLSNACQSNTRTQCATVAARHSDNRKNLILWSWLLPDTCRAVLTVSRIRSWCKKTTIEFPKSLVQMRSKMSNIKQNNWQPLWPFRYNKTQFYLRYSKTSFYLRYSKTSFPSILLHFRYSKTSFYFRYSKPRFTSDAVNPRFASSTVKPQIKEQCQKD